MHKWNIDLSYQRRHNRVIWWFIGTIIVALIPSIPAFFSQEHIDGGFYTYSFVNYVLANEYVHLVVAIILTTYIIFIFTLHDRFEALASLLR